ncbi:MAG: hypothetical protein KA715_13560 [Xanthomonadaceae bacterium]|nr:hypothetical protein [Xanthomonadaceae bacterium]
MSFKWDEAKNKKLAAQGRPGFEFFVEAFDEGLIYFEGENTKRPGQGVFVVIINEYAHVVPYEDRGDHLFLRTLYPSRKWQVVYEKEQKK